MRRPIRFGFAAGLVAGILLAAVGACGSGEQPAVPAASSPAGISGSDASPSPSITGTMTDYAIALSVAAPPAAAVTFVAEQAGQAPHALAIRGPGVDAATAVVPPGGPPQRVTVAPQPGTYQLWCPVGNHRALGMELTITVA